MLFSYLKSSSGQYPIFHRINPNKVTSSSIPLIILIDRGEPIKEESVLCSKA
jgi:hypothetical protein